MFLSLKIMIFDEKVMKNRDFWWFNHQKLWFLMIFSSKIMIFDNFSSKIMIFNDFSWFLPKYPRSWLVKIIVIFSFEQLLFSLKSYRSLLIRLFYEYSESRPTRILIHSDLEYFGKNHQNRFVHWKNWFVIEKFKWEDDYDLN